ncbi:hypothetical protein KIW84_064825 [Lathyrus oleraceus]|uniref:Ribosome-recycling factor, chloroplastic n=1 Tax=Pisum sativum TaxID=3888 RepID=A0A9D4WDB8_PEA|nr:hypothetical protein KIW84_064825 [Pisum sativum]
MDEQRHFGEIQRGRFNRRIPVQTYTIEGNSNRRSLLFQLCLILSAKVVDPLSGRRSKDEGGVSTVEVPPNVGPTIKASAASQMESAMAALSVELSKLRTGRASAGMLDHIIVETGGVKMHLNRFALVSVLDQKTLSVNPYDPETLKQLENAIVSSPLGLNPKTDGERLIAVIPPLTKEHVQTMNRLVTKSCEDTRQSIRRARQKAMDAIKKLNSSLPKDDIKRLEKEVDDLTKKSIKTAEDICKAKEKEISQV